MSKKDVTHRNLCKVVLGYMIQISYFLLKFQIWPFGNPEPTTWTSDQFKSVIIELSAAATPLPENPILDKIMKLAYQGAQG